MPNSEFQIPNSQKSGQLLLELLIAISAAAVITALGASLIYVSLRGSKISGEKNVAVGLVEETLEAVRNVGTERWQGVYDLTKNSNYYPLQSGGKWVLTSGTENITINDVTYTRSFTVQNSCRDVSSRDITGITDSSGASTSTCAGSGGSPDPSTQKTTATVSWPEADPLVATEYLTRWRNKVCVQQTWASQSSATSTCPATTYASSTNITTGIDLRLSQ